MAEWDFIEPNKLISEYFTSNTRAIADSGALKVWFARDGGKQRLASEDFGAQRISALPIARKVTDAVWQQLAIVDELTGLAIRESRRKSTSDIRVYLDTEIVLGRDSGFVALATFNDKQIRPFWEIVVNSSIVKNARHLIYTILHELGHTLGLEHTHDDQDGDVHLTTSSRKSSLPRQTVMSYGIPEWNIYPIQFQVNDLRALQQIWGKGDDKQDVDQLTQQPSAPSLDLEELTTISTRPLSSISINGKAFPLSKIRATLSGELVHETNANSNGSWTLELDKSTIKSNLGQIGAYLRIEQLDPSGYSLLAQPYFFNLL
jgi:hypothetical protein